MKKANSKPNLADDIRVSLREALKYARGGKTDVIVHHVQPSKFKARAARVKLGLSRRAEQV